MTVPSPSGAGTLTTSSGLPKLTVYDQSSDMVADMSASSVSTDGASATFPFPQLSNGNALPPGLYLFDLSNQTSPGKLWELGTGMFGIGSNDTSHQTPFGIDTGTVETWSEVTSWNDDNPWNQYWQGGIYDTTSSVPAVTLLAPGQVCFAGSCLNVGSQPVAVKLYGSSQVLVNSVFEPAADAGTNNVLTNYYAVQPQHAIVANYGSNSVSIVNLPVANGPAGSLAATIPVGHQPTALLLKADQSKAYVANSADSTVSEINLTNNTQSRVALVGTSPVALTMDPSGTALWVGGLNYINKLDLSSFQVVSTFPATGQVTSLAISAGLNQFVYTTISSDLTTFQARHAAITTGTPIKSYAQAQIGGSSPYAHAMMVTYGGTTTPGPPGYLASSAALVSANYGNSIAVVGTPTGFAVLDLPLQIDLMEATTPSPVRGIATDAQQGAVYLTVPDSNSVITVPLPARHTPATATVIISGSEQSRVVDPCAEHSIGSCPYTVNDSGTVSVTVAGAPVSVSYGQGDTPESVAANLASAMNSLTSGDATVSGTTLGFGYPVKAWANGNGITLRTLWTGPDMNYSLSTSCATNQTQYYSGCPSFWATPSGTKLTGGN